LRVAPEAAGVTDAAPIGLSQRETLGARPSEAPQVKALEAVPGLRVGAAVAIPAGATDIHVVPAAVVAVAPIAAVRRLHALPASARDRVVVQLAALGLRRRTVGIFEAHEAAPVLAVSIATFHVERTLRAAPGVADEIAADRVRAVFVRRALTAWLLRTVRGVSLI